MTPETATENLRYPIGRFAFDPEVDDARRRQFIDQIAATPERMRAAVAGLDREQLDTPYRPEGWTVRQVVHHVPESHMNSYIRFKLALTEDEPTIKPYQEDRWAEISDARSAPVELSLALMDALHARWVLVLRALGPADFGRTFRHPELGIVTLQKNVQLYAWHGRHHVAHITRLRDRMRWT